MPTDAEILDQKALIVWANDPDVTFVDSRPDANIAHGINLESEKENIT
jgi:hypothetical protein